jgi:dolichol-phosphate mannosyltransferase
MSEDLISVVIPTYNEQDNITPLVERLAKAFNGHPYEVLFVDDNSKDGTVSTVARLSEKYPVKALVRLKEKGLATAVLHGFKYAQGDTVLVMDADLQHPPEVIPQLIAAIKGGADMAVGSRYVPGGGVPNWSLLRRVISKGALTLAHVFLPTTRRVKDPMSGFYMFRRQVKTPIDYQPTGYKILLEMLVVGNFQKVVEVPFIFEDRSSGRSKMKARQQLDYLKHIFSLMRRTGELTRILKFLVVGLIGTGVNEGILKLVTDFTTWNNYVALIPGIEISILTNFLLNDYFTFSDRRSGQRRSFFGRMLKYNITALAGALINYGVALLFAQVVGLNVLLSNFIGILVAFVWNYLLSTLWTWK